jgi:hypothetical protein
MVDISNAGHLPAKSLVNSAQKSAFSPDFLWDQLGACFTFYVGAAFCTLALIGLAFRRSRTRE